MGGTKMLQYPVAVSQSDPAPLYFQVQQHMKRELTGLEHGSQIDSEGALQERFGVSRVTIRRAIAELIADGVVTSRRGIGHFVADQTKPDIHCLNSFTAEAFRTGHVPSTRLISFGTVAADAEIGEELGVLTGTEIVNVKRLRFLDGKPTFVSDAFLSPRFDHGFNAKSFPKSGASQSLIGIIRQRFQLSVLEGFESTSAVLSDHETSSLLDVSEGQPLVRKSCTFRSHAESTILHERATWGVPITNGVKIKPAQQPYE